MKTIADIRRRFASRQPTLLSPGSSTCAAVALLLRDGACEPEILFIERARHDTDPWSGDLGFPGGKVEHGDGEPQRTAERETREELGLDLSVATCLGRLDDIAGAHLPIVVSCFVYAVSGTPALRLSDELAGAFWLPLRDLADRDRHRQATVHFRGEPLTRPAIDLLGPNRPILWGITYRLIMQFLEIIGESTESAASQEGGAPNP